MATATVETVTRMLEALPESVQERVAERLREYITELDDDVRWDETFQQTRTQLAAAARRAKQEIAEGKAEPFDESRL